MKRANFFSGQQISLFDACYWSDTAGDAIRQRINSDLYFPGAVSGLTVYGSVAHLGYAVVGIGTGYDANGERIRVPSILDPIGYNGVELNNTAATYQIVARYLEGSDGTYGLDINGACQVRHITDSYQIVTLKSGTDSAGANDIVLAGVTATVPGGSLIFDTVPRDIFSAKYFAGGSASSSGSSLSGNVNIGGNLSVDGTITGADETLSGNLTVNNLTVNTNATVSNNLTVSNDIIANHLTLSAGSLTGTLSGGVLVPDNIVAGDIQTNTINVLQGATINALTLTGNVRTNTLTVVQGATINALTLTGNVNAASINGACMIQGGYINGTSNLSTFGDLVALSPGYGLLLTSPDRTKLARVYLGNDGYLQVDSLNYTLS